jgi:hypothetical protein
VLLWVRAVLFLPVCKDFKFIHLEEKHTSNNSTSWAVANAEREKWRELEILSIDHIDHVF